MKIEAFVITVIAISVFPILVVKGQFLSLNKFLNGIDNKVSQLLGNLDNSLKNLVPEIKNFSEKLHKIALCYESELAGHKIDIFNSSLDFKTLVSTFYVAFPNKTINRASIYNLFTSTREIITHCTNQWNRSGNIKKGFTQLSDLSIEDIIKTLGERVDAVPNRTNRFKRLSGNDINCIANIANLPVSFDWRHFGVVSPVRDQGECGSCWAFAAAQSIESAYMIQYTKLNVPFRSLLLSPQMLVDCAIANGCGGSNAFVAMTYIKDHGIVSEYEVPYLSREKTCPFIQHTNPFIQYTKYPIKNFCIRGKYYFTPYTLVENLSDRDIEMSLVQFGPLYTAVDFNPLIYQNYRYGIVSDWRCTTQPNHAVLLVGFTPNAWIIKNTWGLHWGEAGYFRLARGRNMCGINTHIAWPIL